MVNYINGAIRESIEKGKALMSKIPGARDLGIHFAALANTANGDIDELNKDLDFLYSDPAYNDPQNLKSKFQIFRSLTGKLSKIENVVIAAISRKSDDDEFVNKLVYQICNEINYPLPSPAASCLSQKYYHIYPEYNLICIPLLEAEFLLHIPDIYHELGHPLIMIQNNPKTEHFRNNLGYFNLEVKKYFDEEIKRREMNATNNAEIDVLYAWKDNWLQIWSMELFCDLFAAITLGPAYLWSNLHMCTKLSWDVYKVPSQKGAHPPGEARMKAALYGLELIGFEDEAQVIKEKWEEFKKIIDQKKSSDFSIALPESLLKRAAEFCITGTKQIGCQIATKTTTDKVNLLLNNAWKEFWINPEAFFSWEQNAVKQFKESL